MKKSTVMAAALACAFAVSAAPATPREQELAARIPAAFARAAEQYTGLLKDMEGKQNCFPKRWQDGKLVTVPPEDWCSGFFPGSLWYLYEYTKDDSWKAAAEKYTAIQDQIRHYTGNHDIGFMLMTSVGNALRLAPKPEYKGILLDGAAALTKRYSPKLGIIRSWGKIEEEKNFLVIIDNMMNLELMEWAAKNGGDPRFADIAKSHADATDRNHFRADDSAYHVLNYNQLTGKLLEIRAGQGASVDGTWSRGHSWAIYGFTMMYRETKDPRYLARAVKSAEYAIHVPTLTADKIPYWDYKAVGIPNEERDASAAAIMASALLELSQYVSAEKSAAYRAFAVDQLISLSSDAYLAQPGANGHFILLHSTGSKPSWYNNNKYGELDVPLNYADYYYLEALLRFRSMIGG